MKAKMTRQVFKLFLIVTTVISFQKGALSISISNTNTNSQHVFINIPAFINKPPPPPPPPATYRRQPVITTPKPCPALADIVFVIDSSGSLGLDNYLKEQQFAIDISRRFPIGRKGARFGCIIFSSTAQVAFTLIDNLDQVSLEEALKDLPYLNATTHTFKAFDTLYAEEIFSAENGGRNNAAKIVILLTDGNSSDLKRTADAAKRVKNQGVSILSIGVGEYSLAELRAVASDPRNVFTAPSFSVLEKITQEVEARACQVPSEGIKYKG